VHRRATGHGHLALRLVDWGLRHVGVSIDGLWSRRPDRRRLRHHGATNPAHVGPGGRARGVRLWRVAALHGVVGVERGADDGWRCRLGVLANVRRELRREVAHHLCMGMGVHAVASGRRGIVLLFVILAAVEVDGALVLVRTGMLSRGQRLASHEDGMLKLTYE
jgi:hypothetical protein